MIRNLFCWRNEIVVSVHRGIDGTSFGNEIVATRWIVNCHDHRIKVNRNSVTGCTWITWLAEQTLYMRCDSWKIILLFHRIFLRFPFHALAIFSLRTVWRHVFERKCTIAWSWLFIKNYNRETITDNGIEVVNREQKYPEERYYLFVMLDFVKRGIKRITERERWKM